MTSHTHTHTQLIKMKDMHFFLIVFALISVHMLQIAAER